LTINKNRIEFFFFSILTKLLKLIGLKSTRRVGKIVGSVVYYVIPIRKKVVIDNLTRAFPSKNKSEIKKIALCNYQSTTITFFEFMCFPSLSKEELKSILDISISDNCKKIIDDKDGFIFLTGHLGNWELFILTFRLNFDLDFYILVKPQRNPFITKWTSEVRAAFGNKIISVGGSVPRIVEALDDGGGIFIAADQRGPVDGPRINFMGIPTAYYMGTPSIISKTKSKVMIGFVIRQSNNNYKMNLEELDLTNLPADNTLQVAEILNRYIKILEKYVKKYPEQYFWMHKIWKY
jgi:KDO2-lipid IV(A) lauroyltransferase